MTGGAVAFAAADFWSLSRAANEGASTVWANSASELGSSTMKKLVRMSLR